MLAIVAIASIFTGLTQGSVSIPFSQFFTAETLHYQIIWELRFPRVISAFIVGGSLAIAGALMQILLRNPLADPYILGISGGAGVGALTALMLGLGTVFVQSLAFSGAMLTTLLVFVLAREHGRQDSTRLLLTGVVLAAGWGAIISLLLTLSPDSQVKGLLFWLMGDLGAATPSWWSLLALFAGLIAALLVSRSLNLLAAGEAQAAVLGVEVPAVRLIIYLSAALLTASAVTQAGPIGFVGLIIPHLLRLSGFHDHRLLLPACLFAGGSLLVIADTLARTVIAPGELPVGVLTAFLGVPLFLYLLGKQNRATYD